MDAKNVVAAADNGLRTERWTSLATAAQKKTVTKAAELLKITVSDYIGAVGLARAKELDVN